MRPSRTARPSAKEDQTSELGDEVPMIEILSIIGIAVIVLMLWRF